MTIRELEKDAIRHDIEEAERLIKLADTIGAAMCEQPTRVKWGRRNPELKRLQNSRSAAIQKADILTRAAAVRLGLW